MKGPMNKDLAIREYNEKHRDKTVKGNYVELEINYDDGAGDAKPKDEGKPKKAAKTGTSKLHP
jgi:hypothetical protein